MNNATHIESGSFRDPSGRVFYYKGQVYRSMDKSCADLMERLRSAGLLSALCKEGLLVGTSIVDARDPLYTELSAQMPEAYGFLCHEKIPFVSYPYEWTATMLADAAELTLRLQLRLLENGFSLKDATTYNVQFQGGRPIFIDLSSIEAPVRADVWMAYGQFCRMFLFPLLLYRHRRCDLKGYFLANMEGMDVEHCFRVLGMWCALRPSMFVDVFLQRLLQKMHVGGLLADAGKSGEGKPGSTEKREKDCFAQKINLGRLIRKTASLRAQSAVCKVVEKNNASLDGSIASNWTGYAEKNSYSTEAEQEKVSFIRQCLVDHRPESLLDLGCNTGKYSMLAAELGVRVTSVDADHDCVDILYSDVVRERKDILPLWMNVANLSPSIGFMNIERHCFVERARFDCVLALALVHHLLVTARIPLTGIRDLLWSLSQRWVIVECVPAGDPMFETLLTFREDIYKHVTPSYFEDVFGERFKVVSSRELPGTKRVLFMLEKREDIFRRTAVELDGRQLKIQG